MIPATVAKKLSGESSKLAVVFIHRLSCTVSRLINSALPTRQNSRVHSENLMNAKCHDKLKDFPGLQLQMVRFVQLAGALSAKAPVLHNPTEDV